MDTPGMSNHYAAMTSTALRPSQRHLSPRTAWGMVGVWHIVRSGRAMCGVAVPTSAPWSDGQHGPPVLAPVCRECVHAYTRT